MPDAGESEELLWRSWVNERQRQEVRNTLSIGTSAARGILGAAVDVYRKIAAREPVAFVPSQLQRAVGEMAPLCKLLCEKFDQPVVQHGQFAGTSAHEVLFNLAQHLLIVQPTNPRTVKAMLAPFSVQHDVIAAQLDREMARVTHALRSRVTFQEALDGAGWLRLPPLPARTLYRWVKDPDLRVLLGTMRGCPPRSQTLLVDGLRELVRQQQSGAPRAAGGVRGNSRQTTGTRSTARSRRRKG